MEDIDGPKEATIDFIPAICFIKKGVAKERPDKITLTPAELANVIKETRDQLGSDHDDDDDDDDDDENEDNAAMETDDAPENPNDEFNFNDYDGEGDNQVIGIGDVAVIDENEAINDDDNDSEGEDEIIKPSDNLILLGRVQDDAASMEVWIFNEEEESLYTHHDFLLPSFPLCIEWLNYDPGSEKTGNLCAIGCMDPIITIWDLDIQDSIEATFKLGSRKKKDRYGHTDAVLDLSWNTFFPHILASGSVDKTVILWDLDEGSPHTTITKFEEKVQSIAFHPTEAQNLLAGCADGFVRNFDCRNPGSINSSFVEWKAEGEIEKVIWNPNDSNFFISGTSDGKFHYADIRRPGIFLWSTDAHSDEVSGISFNSQKKNMISSTGADGLLKIWKFNESEINEVYSHDFKLGRIHCMAQCPDDPFTFVFGGEKAPRCRVFNLKNFEAVRSVFDIPAASS